MENILQKREDVRIKPTDEDVATASDMQLPYSSFGKVSLYNRPIYRAINAPELSFQIP
jgi:hypothetical protein